MRKMNSEKRFRMICLIILLIFTAICVAPFLLMVAASVTDENALIAEGYRFWPSKFSLAVSGGCGREDVEKIRNDGDRRTTGSQKGRTGLE